MLNLFYKKPVVPDNFMKLSMKHNSKMNISKSWNSKSKKRVIRCKEYFDISIYDIIVSLANESLQIHSMNYCTNYKFYDVFIRTKVQSSAKNLLFKRAYFSPSKIRTLFFIALPGFMIPSFSSSFQIFLASRIESHQGLYKVL